MSSSKKWQEEAEESAQQLDGREKNPWLSNDDH